jgi:hypothetical protein
MFFHGFEFELYGELQPENWCLCWHEDKLFLEIFLPDGGGGLRKRVDNDNTRESVAAKYNLPVTSSET